MAGAMQEVDCRTGMEASMPRPCPSVASVSNASESVAVATSAAAGAAVAVAASVVLNTVTSDEFDAAFDVYFAAGFDESEAEVMPHFFHHIRSPLSHFMSPSFAFSKKPIFARGVLNWTTQTFAGVFVSENIFTLVIIIDHSFPKN